jgi:hypothetical protein
MYFATLRELASAINKSFKCYRLKQNKFKTQILVYACCPWLVRVHISITFVSVTVAKFKFVHVNVHVHYHVYVNDQVHTTRT